MTKLQTICCSFGLKQKLVPFSGGRRKLNRNERHIEMPGPQPFKIGFLKYLLSEQAEATIKEPGAISYFYIFRIATGFSGRTIIFSHQNFYEMFKMMWYVPSAMP